MLKKILVYLDGSEFAEHILQYVTEQARHFGSRVILLRVQTTSISSASSATLEQPDMTLSSISALAHHGEELSAKTYLGKIATTLSGQGIDVECATLSGTIGDAIVRYAQRNEVDLIAMTSHAYKGWRRLLLGSTVDDVLRKCQIPVLVVNNNSDNTMKAS